jgi:hypothetical protein
MNLRLFALAVVCLSCAAFSAYARPARPIVVELFTAQGCPSCPAADALLKQLVTDPSILPLSFHVTYFDNRGWKDPYAAPANTARQKRYVTMLGVESAYTPHIVVDGAISAVGSDANAVVEAIRIAANSEVPTVPLSITPALAGDGLDVVVGDSEHPIPPDATLYEVHFNRRTITPISAGNNNGLTVENINNVVAFFPVITSPQYFVPTGNVAEDGIAYLLHNSKGHVLGAAYYLKP